MTLSPTDLAYFKKYKLDCDQCQYDIDKVELKLMNCLGAPHFAPSWRDNDLLFGGSLFGAFALGLIVSSAVSR